MSGPIKTSWIDDDSWEYHANQWTHPKRSTFWAIELLNKHLSQSAKVLDVGCGGGAVTASFARVFPQTYFLGVDNETELIEFAEKKRNKIS